MRLNQFKASGKGMQRFFGPLESKIMEILWHHGELSIKEVQMKLESDRSLNFNTVMTVMNRLLEKGVLTKRMDGRTSIYRPLLPRDEFLNNQSKEITHELLEDFGPLVVNHMLDALEDADPELLGKLEDKLKSLRKGAKE